MVRARLLFCFAHVTLENQLLEKFQYVEADSVDGFKKTVKEGVDVVVIGENEQSGDLIAFARSKSKKTFICYFSHAACESPATRLKLFNELGVNMVSCDVPSLHVALETVTKIFDSPGKLSCVRCEAKNLSEDSLWHHDPLYHANWTNLTGTKCPICKKTVRGPYAVHLHIKHGPIGRGEEFTGEGKRHPSLYSFALVVCRHPITKKYLVVQEFCNSGYWLPGGAVDAGEDIKIAALRETKEEAGLDVELKGVLRVEISPKGEYVRLRVIFYAEPVDDTPPKSIPDYESVGATWITADEIEHSHLRGKEPLSWSRYLEGGGPIYPLSTLTSEHTPVIIPEQN